jgi:hypothetical protein
LGAILRLFTQANTTDPQLLREVRDLSQPFQCFDLYQIFDDRIRVSTVLFLKTSIIAVGGVSPSGES